VSLIYWSNKQFIQCTFYNYTPVTYQEPLK